MTGAGLPDSAESPWEGDYQVLYDIGLVAISLDGAKLAARLAGLLPGSSAELLPGAVRLHLVDRHADSVAVPATVEMETFSLPLRPVLARLFKQYRRLVLFMPVGAAVRLLAPSLKHKHYDPAVVCVDDAGKYAVSLLSGHVGGADALAFQVASILGAEPVITSASHVKDTLAVDLLGREFGWQLEAESATVTRVSAAVVNGEQVGIYQDAGELEWWPDDRALPSNLKLYANLKELSESDCIAGLLITDKITPMKAETGTGSWMDRNRAELVVYRPRSLVVGMGCRRGVSAQHLKGLLLSAFDRHGLSLTSIKCIATAEIKRDEPGIIQLAAEYGVPVICFNADELNGVFDRARSEAVPAGEIGSGGPVGLGPTPSPVAHRLLGVWGVSEPAALLASGAAELLVTREKTDRATLAVARIPFH